MQPLKQIEFDIHDVSSKWDCWIVLSNINSRGSLKIRSKSEEQFFKLGGFPGDELNPKALVYAGSNKTKKKKKQHLLEI